MGIFKLAVLVVITFFSAIAIFLGAVMMITGLQNGAVTISYTQSGKSITDTVTRAGDAARFWQLMGTMGALPFVVGAAAMWYSVRKLRGN